jgi:hypothetical protein
MERLPPGPSQGDRTIEIIPPPPQMFSGSGEDRSLTVFIAGRTRCRDAAKGANGYTAVSERRMGVDS